MTRKIRDNGAEASIHFQKAETIAFYHNSREAFKPETSHAELEKMNECDKTAEEARELFEKLSAQGDENFLKNCGRRTNMKASNKLWESVMNLREHHTLEDVQRVNAKIQEITGFIPVQTSLHRDEGHVDEKTGDFIQNVHAQTLWITQNPEDGKSMAYLLFGRKDIYRQIQDVVAEELGMTRGQSAEITGARHFKNMRDYKQMKRSESKLNKEWEAKLEANNKEWQAKMAEKQAEWEQKKAVWEAKQAEREARQEEWEQKIPEIIAARERRSKFICEKLDWESARTGKKLAYEMEMLGISFAGVSNPQGNIIIEAQKDAIRNIFYMLGTTAQLAVFLLKKTLANDEKIKSDLKIYNVEATLLRAVDYVANSDPANAEELKIRIQRTFRTIPEEKREELFQYALENAPTPELQNDIRALIEGRFSDIARTEQAQKRIENRDLRAALKEYSEEIRKIRDELREMEEENRVLNAAERAILKQKGATRDEYAEQEAENRKRLEEIKELKQQAKDVKKTIDEQREEKDAKTIAEQAEQITKMTAQIAEITEANVKKQKQLEDAKEEARQTAPQMPQDAFNVIDELEEQLKQREEPKPEPEPEPEPIAKKDDNLNIFGYERYVPEPRRRFDDYEPRPREIDRPKYEPEPIREPEKIEPISEEPIFRDPWQEIENEIEKWKKADSEVEKKMLSPQIFRDIEKYEKSGVPPHRQLALDAFRRDLNYDPAAADAEAIRQMRERELERKRQEAAELEKKYDDVKVKNVRKEDDTKQQNLKKKRRDEYEMGMN